MEALKKFGWRLSEDSVCNYFGDDLPANSDSLHKALLDCDIREVISSDDAAPVGRVAPTGDSGDITEAPLIMQIQKVRNVAVPKAQENDTSAAARLLRLSMTDGKTTFSSLEMGTIKGLDAKTPPGTKIQLTNVVRNERGFLLLTSSNCRILGGKVEKLIEKWRLKDPNALTRPRPGADGQSGPPPWVPFGQKPQFSDGVLSSATKNLRVMDLAASGRHEAPPISEEFNQARQNVIAQAMQHDQQKAKKAHQPHS